MNSSRKVEKQAIEIMKLLKPALVKRAGRFETAWGRKTEKGLKASIFNISVDLERRYEEEGVLK